MIGFGKNTRFSPLGQAMIIVVMLLMFVVRWFFFGSVLREFNYDFILLPLAAIVLGVLLYSRYRQRERQRVRAENIQVAIIIDQLRQGREPEDAVPVKEVYLDDEACGYQQTDPGTARGDSAVEGI